MKLRATRARVSTSSPQWLRTATGSAQPPPSACGCSLARSSSNTRGNSAASAGADSGGSRAQDTALIVSLVLALFTIVFGTRSLDVTEHHRGMVLAIAFESLVKLAAFLAVGIFVTFGLYDGKSRRTYTLTLKNPDVLAKLEPDKSDAWRSLDVAILQRYLLDEVLRPHFAAGRQLTRGYTADPSTIPHEVDGHKYQLALLLKSTPLHALEDLGKHGEVMPQKSTYFFPKLPSGAAINPLD